MTKSPTTKRTKSLIVSALATTLFAGAAAAQTPAKEAEHGRRIAARAHRAVAARTMRRLELSDAQREQMKALREKQRAAFRAKAEAMRAELTRLRELTRSDSPDALAVGQATLKVAAMRKENLAARKAAREEFLSILTPEQKQRLEAMKERRSVVRRRMHERIHERFGRRFGRDGRG